MTPISLTPHPKRIGSSQSMIGGENSFIAIAGTRILFSVRIFLGNTALLAAPRLMQIIEAFSLRIVSEFCSASTDGVFLGQRLLDTR